MSQHLNKRSRAAFEKEERSPYLIYGTPFPPKTEEKPDIYKPIWKQEVVDERGRKRLHGAFQGGFSAGYFNTVGSKEGDFATPGWTPSTFISSRTNRAKIVAPKPEDFMDDDDLTEAAADEERRLQREAENSGLTAEALADQGLNNTAELFKILHSVDEFPLGKEILHNLGWREGQGIGPKIRRKLRDQDAGEDDFKTFLFAPDDVVLPSWMKDPPKTDTKGLGYSEELRGDDDEPLESLKPSRKPVAAKPNVRLGMGVGVFNDDGEDDEDIYEIKPKSAYNKAIGGDKKKKKKAVAADAGAPGLGKPVTIAPGRHVFVSKKDSLNKPKVKRCMDGTLPLPGFMLDDEPLEAKWANDTPLPEVPDDWIPQRRLANPDQYIIEMSRSEESMKQLNPREIGSLLGEEQLPNKSVFDFLTPAARERIAAATGKNNLPRALGEQVNTGKDAAQKMQDAIPYLEQSVAMNALKGFLPYADAPEKRQRYRAFLESKAGTRPATLVKDKGVSLEDWARELHEFAHAARIFKPVTGLMANRFTSSSSNASQLPTTGGSKGLEGVEETLISRPTAKVEDPAVTAAKMGMFGPMTRTTIQFFPTRLLCKRFNVPPPIHVDPLNDESFGESGGVATKDVELVNKVELNRLMIEANTNPGWKSSGEKGSGHGDKAVGVGLEPMDVDEIAVKTSEEALPYIDLLEEERPGIEVFKAIFGDDTDEEDD